MEVNPRTLKEEQAEATRTALLDAARELFAERGYAGVGTEEIVRRARVTRGALYHHFRGKEDLFGAVFEAVEEELMTRIAQEAAAAADPWEAMREGARAFLDASLEPAVQRICLLDAPAVLGYDRWREIGERYGVGLLQAVLEAAMESGDLPRQPVRPLAYMLTGALDEAAMLVARADDVAAARAEVGETVERMLEALRAR